MGEKSVFQALPKRVCPRPVLQISRLVTEVLWPLKMLLTGLRIGLLHVYIWGPFLDSVNVKHDEQDVWLRWQSACLASVKLESHSIL